MTERKQPPVIVSGPQPQPEPPEPVERRSGWQTAGTVAAWVLAGICVLMSAVIMLGIVIAVVKHPSEPSTTSSYTTTAAPTTTAARMSSVEQDYLHNVAAAETLHGDWFYDRIGEQALLAEGYKACQAYRAGWDEDAIRDMIAADLHLSDAGVSAVKVGAEMDLGC
jgi:hypothetical protein